MRQSVFRSLADFGNHPDRGLFLLEKLATTTTSSSRNFDNTKTALRPFIRLNNLLCNSNRSYNNEEHHHHHEEKVILSELEKTSSSAMSYTIPTKKKAGSCHGDGPTLEKVTDPKYNNHFSHAV